jgi:hypothetical protein
MEIELSVSESGAFRRLSISASEAGRLAECGLSAIITSPSGREEIFLPSPEKLASNVTYPSSGGRFVTCTGKGRYQIIFQPKEKGEHEINLMGRSSGKAFEKAVRVSF